MCWPAAGPCSHAQLPWRSCLSCPPCCTSQLAGDPLLAATPSLAQALAAVQGSEIDTNAPPKLQVRSALVVPQSPAASCPARAAGRCEAGLAGLLVLSCTWPSCFSTPQTRPSPTAPGCAGTPPSWLPRPRLGADARCACAGARRCGTPAACGAAAAGGGGGGIPLPRSG